MRGSTTKTLCRNLDFPWGAPSKRHQTKNQTFFTIDRQQEERTFGTTRSCERIGRGGSTCDDDDSVNERGLKLLHIPPPEAKARSHLGPQTERRRQQRIAPDQPAKSIHAATIFPRIFDPLSFCLVDVAVPLVSPKKETTEKKRCLALLLLNLPCTK